MAKKIIVSEAVEDLHSKEKSSSIDKHVGKRLKTRRTMLGLSQRDLSIVVGVSTQQIQKYENGTNRISSGKLYIFAKILRVQLDFFFLGAEKHSDSHRVSDDENMFTYSDILEKELLALIQAYRGIDDISLRKKIIDLLKTLSNTTA